MLACDRCQEYSGCTRRLNLTICNYQAVPIPHKIDQKLSVNRRSTGVDKYFLLLQINDATFPIGSYTQSYGLETYVQQQIVKDAVSLKQYLLQNLTCNLLYGDILAAKLAYAAAMEQSLGKISELDEVFSALKIAKETRSASIKLASRFIKTIMALKLDFKSNNIFLEYAQLIQQGLCLGHYAIAYGAMCGALQLDKHLSLVHFSYAQVSSMVNNAVKLIPLSQTVGQTLLQEMYVNLEDVLTQLEHLTITHLGRSCPAFELRSMQHERLYSRLYMS